MMGGGTYLCDRKRRKKEKLSTNAKLPKERSFGLASLQDMSRELWKILNTGWMGVREKGWAAH
jgi:hypothetical protein